jgi:hypothetical protein
MRLTFAAIALAATAAHAAPAHRPTVKTVTIDYTYRSFHRSEMHYVIEAKPGGGFELTDKKVSDSPIGRAPAARRGSNDGSGAPAASSGDAARVSVDAAPIDALYTTLTGLHEVDSVQRCISHTDDYPKFTVTIDGERPIELASNSNCHLGVPWMVTEHGKLAAQYNGAIGIAVHELLAAIDPDHWTHRPDTPEAFTGLGNERMMLDEFTGIQQAGSPATACAKSVETNPRIRAALGEDVHVSKLQLNCDLSTSSDCAIPTATVSFRWQGVDVTFDVSCLKGQVDASAAFIADVTDARSFLESKPVATLKSLAKNGPRVTRGDTWRVETWDELPTLEYAPGSLVVRARAIATEHGPGGGAFWKALGLDAKRLTHENKALLLVETLATLDFAGKLIQ